MSTKSIHEYTVIREYNNLYGLEEVIKRIIRHHINDISIENLSQGYTSQQVKIYGKQNSR